MSISQNRIKYRYIINTKYAQEQSFNLIETLANKLADKILSEYSMIISVQLKVRKYGVPMAGAFDDIEIEVFKKQK